MVKEIEKNIRRLMEVHLEWNSSTSGNPKWIEEFNHTWLQANLKPSKILLDLGCGIGNHYPYCRCEEYRGIDISTTAVIECIRRHPEAEAIVTDGVKIPYPTGHFDTVCAIHLLEHLEDLPTVLDEVHRVLKSNGEFGVVIPLEGGFVRRLANKFDKKRNLLKAEGVDPDWYFEHEHCNNAWEILEELDKRFIVKKSCYFPFGIPLVSLNLKVGLIQKPRER